MDWVTPADVSPWGYTGFTLAAPGRAPQLSPTPAFAAAGRFWRKMPSEDTSLPTNAFSDAGRNAGAGRETSPGISGPVRAGSPGGEGSQEGKGGSLMLSGSSAGRA